MSGVELAIGRLLRLAHILQPRLTVLIFHHVLPEPDALRPLQPDVARFRRFLQWIGRHFEVVALPEALATAPRRARRPRLGITFDDGYRDNLELAVPLLHEYGFHATFFVTTAYAGGGMMWNDRVLEAVRAWPERTMDLRDLGLGEHPLPDDGARRRASSTIGAALKYRPADERERLATEIARRAPAPPRGPMMGPAEIRRLADAGMEVGGHTHSHPILARIDLDRARAEIAENTRLLGEYTGRRPRLFAYPNGRPGQDYGPEHVGLVRELGFEAAFSTAPGASAAGHDRFELPRFTPWDDAPAPFLARLARNYFRDGARA